MPERPMPPQRLFDIEYGDQFVPAPEIVEWAFATFIREGASLYNPEHQHLEQAQIGALWTNVGNSKNGRSIVGQCEAGDPMAMGKWAKAKARIQVEQWFGLIPDFILTFDAGYAEQCSDMAFSALVENELLHASQARDEFGAPRFNKQTGRPVFAIRGHDFEGFVNIAARYGIIEAGVKELVEALQRPPLFTADDVGFVCGTCEARKAA